ncbi:unnamed protein product, partial [Brassica rapa]
SPRRPKSPEQCTGRVSVLSPRTNVLLCVLMDSHGRLVHGRPVCADGHRGTHTDTHRPPRTSCVCWWRPTDVLSVLTRQPTWAKITRTVHGKGQCAESKDQHADMCTDGQYPMSCVYSTDSPQGTKSPEQSTGRVSVLNPRTNVLICVLMDSHGRPRADMCTDGQPRTSHVLHGPKSPEQSTGRVSVLSPTTNVLICVLMDSHRRHVCFDGHTRTHTDSHGCPVQPTWAKITRTVHGKGQRAESKDQHADMCTDGQ